MADEERELAHFRGEGGQVIGMDLPLDETMQDKVTKGYLKRVNEDGTPYVEADEPEQARRPALNAAKPEWVGYAVKALGMDPDDAEAATKQDLIDLANQQ